MKPCLVDVGPDGRERYVVREAYRKENENLERRESSSLWWFI